MQNMEVPIDEMWKTIEAFGIKRKLLDPRDRLSYRTIRDLYLAIKTRKNNNRF
jgi:hypothetical protein